MFYVVVVAITSPVLEKKALTVAGAAGEEKMLLVSKEKLLVLAGDYCGWRRERVASMASCS